MSRIGIRTGNRLEVMGDTPSRQEGETALAELLVLRGTIDRAGLDRAWRAQEGTGRKLPEVLAALGLVAERELAAGLAEVLSLPLARPEDYPRAPVLDGRLSPKFLKAREFLPLSETESGLVAAMVDPADDFAARAVEVKIAKPVERRIAVPSELEEALERLYGSGRTQIEEIVDSLDGEGDAAPDDAERLRDLASEAPVIRLVGLLIAESVERRASDIHIEPFDNRLRVRYRIDGVMQEVASHPSRLRFAIISRIKIMAKLNIAERRLPQDGRIRLSVRGNEVDLRVSTVPTDHGESVVLRVLDKSAVVLDFDRLGFAPDNRDAIRALLARPNGIVLVTGPTGSGKTTTLYTALMELNGHGCCTWERKILTVEDPIELQIEGINQIAIRPQIGLGFAEVLRSILRQDPDIIMVGEIRDLETAQIAVQAALTGHTVLSTLHTNSCSGSGAAGCSPTASWRRSSQRTPPLPGPCSDPSSADRARPPAASGNRRRGPGSRRPAPAMPRSRRGGLGHKAARDGHRGISADLDLVGRCCPAPGAPAVPGLQPAAPGLRRARRQARPRPAARHRRAGGL